MPADRIVYVSELLFYDRFPWMNSGYIDWINTIDIVLNLNADIFVPGQGPANWMSNPKASRQALINFRQILVDARDAVEKEIARGATEDQTVTAVRLPQYTLKANKLLGVATEDHLLVLSRKIASCANAADRVWEFIRPLRSTSTSDRPIPSSFS